MSKIARLESNGMLHCCYYPLCSVTRSIDLESVSFPRKAAQQYILKHEKVCTFNPTCQGHNEANVSSHTVLHPSPSPNTRFFSTQALPSPDNNNYQSFIVSKPQSNAVDCVLLSECRSDIKVEQKWRNITLISLGLSSRGLSVWSSLQAPPQLKPSFSLLVMLQECKHIVLIVQRGDFKDYERAATLRAELSQAKELNKKLTIVLFDTLALLTTIPPGLFDDSLLAWLQSADIYVVQMSLFHVIINSIANSIHKLLW
jgi:hypothetical protein